MNVKLIQLFGIIEELLYFCTIKVRKTITH